MLPIKKIICPTDFSEPSHEGIKAASELAASFAAELILLHIVKPVPAYFGDRAPSIFHIPAVIKDKEAAAAEMLEKLKASNIKKSINARPLVVCGKPADEIVRTAEEEGAQMIVFTTRGRSGWQRFISGSVTEKVTRIAPCAVLSIPPPLDGK